MVLTLLSGNYPDNIGRRSAFVGVGTGPAVYNNTTGDIVTVNVKPYYIDLLFGGVLDTTGTIVATAKSSGSGVRQTWALFYSTFSTGVPLVNASTAANGLTFQIGGFGGSF